MSGKLSLTPLSNSNASQANAVTIATPAKRNLALLPHVVLGQIFKFLPPEHVALSQRTCTAFKSGFRLLQLRAGTVNGEMLTRLIPLLSKRFFARRAQTFSSSSLRKKTNKTSSFMTQIFSRRSLGGAPLGRP